MKRNIILSFFCLFLSIFAFAQGGDTTTLKLSDCAIVFKVNDFEAIIDDFRPLLNRVDDFMYALSYDEDAEPFDIENILREDWLNELFKNPIVDKDGNFYLAIERLDFSGVDISEEPLVYIMVPINRDLLGEYEFDIDNEFIISGDYAVFTNISWDEQDITEVIADVEFSLEEKIVLAIKGKLFSDFTNDMRNMAKTAAEADLLINPSMTMLIDNSIDRIEMALYYKDDDLRVSGFIAFFADSDLGKAIKNNKADATAVLKYLPKNDYSLIYALDASNQELAAAFADIYTASINANFNMLLTIIDTVGGESILSEEEKASFKEIYTKLSLSMYLNSSCFALTTPYNNAQNRAVLFTATEVPDIEEYKSLINDSIIMMDAIMINDINKNYGGDYDKFIQERPSISVLNASNEFAGIEGEFLKFTITSPPFDGMGGSPITISVYTAYLDENVVLCSVGRASTERFMVSNMIKAIVNVRDNGANSFLTSVEFAALKNNILDNPYDFLAINTPFLIVSIMDLVHDDPAGLNMMLPFIKQIDNNTTFGGILSSSNYGNGRMNFDFSLKGSEIDFLLGILNSF